MILIISILAGELAYCQLSRGCFSNLWNELGDWYEGSRIIEFQVMAFLILILNSSSTYFTDPH
jgi:hypothetical protein